MYKGERHPGDSSYENHVFFVGHFGGLKWTNIRAHAQEAEAGQMAFDLTKHSGLLDFGRYIYKHLHICIYIYKYI
jgi:hypothetical protein